METISNMTSTSLLSTYRREGKNTQPVLTLNPNVTLCCCCFGGFPPPCFSVLSFYTLSANVSSRRFVTSLPKYVRVWQRDKKQRQWMESPSCGSQTGSKWGTPTRHVLIAQTCTAPVLSDVGKHKHINARTTGLVI